MKKKLSFKAFTLIPFAAFLIPSILALSVVVHFVSERRKSMDEAYEIQKSLDHAHHQGGDHQAEWKIRRHKKMDESTCRKLQHSHALDICKNWDDPVLFKPSYTRGLLGF